MVASSCRPPAKIDLYGILQTNMIIGLMTQHNVANETAAPSTNYFACPENEKLILGPYLDSPIGPYLSFDIPATFDTSRKHLYVSYYKTSGTGGGSSTRLSLVIVTLN